MRIFAVNMTETHPNPAVRAAAEAARHYARARAARDELVRLMAGAPVAPPPASEQTPPLPAAVVAFLRGADDAIRKSFAKRMKLTPEKLLEMLTPAFAEPAGLPEGHDKDQIEAAAGTLKAPVRASRDASGGYVSATTPAEARALIVARAAAERGGR